MKPSTVMKMTDQDLKIMVSDYLSNTNQEVGKVDIDIKTEYVGFYETMETKVVVLVTKNAHVSGYPIETVDTYAEADIKEIIKFMLQDSGYIINRISLNAYAASRDGINSLPARLESIDIYCTKKDMEKVMKQ